MHGKYLKGRLCSINTGISTNQCNGRMKELTGLGRKVRDIWSSSQLGYTHKHITEAIGVNVGSNERNLVLTTDIPPPPSMSALLPHRRTKANSVWGTFSISRESAGTKETRPMGL